MPEARACKRAREISTSGSTRGESVALQASLLSYSTTERAAFE
jgi:hypothetical protein